MAGNDVTASGKRMAGLWSQDEGVMRVIYKTKIH